MMIFLRRKPKQKKKKKKKLLKQPLFDSNKTQLTKYFICIYCFHLNYRRPQLFFKSSVYSSFFFRSSRVKHIKTYNKYKKKKRNPYNVGNSNNRSIEKLNSLLLFLFFFFIIAVGYLLFSKRILYRSVQIIYAWLHITISIVKKYKKTNQNICY